MGIIAGLLPRGHSRACALPRKSPAFGGGRRGAVGGTGFGGRAAGRGRWFGICRSRSTSRCGRPACSSSLAGAGLQAGAGLEAALPQADATLFAAGVGILVVSQAVFVGLAFWLLPRQTGALLGGLAALQTQPGALVFAVSRHLQNEVNSAYAAVYPLCLILKIIIAQLLILPLAA